MSACKLVEVYQDVLDLKSQELDNYKYLLPSDDGSRLYDKTNHLNISDVYNEVANEEDGNKKDRHIYESLYEFSREKSNKAEGFQQPPLPDRVHTFIRQSRNVMIKNKNNDAKSRVPLGDCSNWTLSTTCGESFFECNKNAEKNEKNKPNVMIKDDRNNNNLLSKLRNRNKQNNAKTKSCEVNKTSNNLNIDHQRAVKHLPLDKTCKKVTRLNKYSSVFSQHKQFKKSLEKGDNPNLNPIRSTDLGREKMCKKDKEGQIKRKILKYFHI